MQEEFGNARVLRAGLRQVQGLLRETQMQCGLTVNVVNERYWERLFLWQPLLHFLAEEGGELVARRDPVHHSLHLGQDVQADSLRDVSSQRRRRDHSLGSLGGQLAEVLQDLDNTPVGERERRLDEELVFVCHVINAEELLIGPLVLHWVGFEVLLLFLSFLLFLFFIDDVFDGFLRLIQVPGLLEYSVHALESSLEIAWFKSQLRFEEV